MTRRGRTFLCCCLLTRAIAAGAEGQATVLSPTSRWEDPLLLLGTPSATEGLRVGLVAAVEQEGRGYRAKVVLHVLDEEICYWPELVTSAADGSHREVARQPLGRPLLPPRSTSEVVTLTLPEASTDARWAVHGECRPRIVTILGGRGGPALGLNKPRGLAVLADGGVFVADKGNGRVLRISSEGRVLLSLDRARGDTRPFDHPTDLELDAPRGELYACDENNRRIVVMDLEGRLQRLIPLPGEEPLQKPVDLALSPDGSTVYVLDAALPAVVVMDRDGRRLLRWGEFGTGPGQFSVPLDIETASDGSVLVSDGANGSVQVFSPTGALQSALGASLEPGATLRYPAAVVPLPDGQVLVADFAADRIRLLGSDGREWAWFGTQCRDRGGLNYPADALLVGSHLYVAVTATDTISVFDIGNWLERARP